MLKAKVPFSKIPDSPGVYFFKKGSDVLYVGKATSLRSRVRSYFDGVLEEKRGPLVAQVVKEASRVAWQETDSVLEALLLEAKFIKELKPRGNTLAKDDKSWNYVVITNEEFPCVVTVRGRELEARFAPKARRKTYGPFTQGASLQAALKIIRKIFPYFDERSRVPATRRFNQSIGIYPSVSALEYRKIIRNIEFLFEGRKKALLKTLEREMLRAAKSEDFERADNLKRQIFALKHIQDIALLKDEYRAPRATAFRVEAFDTAHLRGASPRAVMAVVVDGEPEKSEYRTFTIRTAKDSDDYQALREVLTRRFKHPEWAFPKLIVIDGGRTHLTVARAVLKHLGVDIDVVSVVKDERHRPREILGPSALAHAHESSILLANAEAHRFSLARHRRALRKSAV